MVCFHFSGHAYWYYYGYAGSDWGYNGLGYYFGIVPINISVYVDYGDGVRNSGGIGINYANSYYDGVDSRSAYSGTYYLDGGGWVYSDENPDEPWLASGQTGSRSLQADNINDFYINVAPN
ncbi:MAG: hypothetical protein M1469_11900 [Bacteroidetes bacterium]|nr:hypothetical protein [Bacteroidota bacterium]